MTPSRLRARLIARQLYPNSRQNSTTSPPTYNNIYTWIKEHWKFSTIQDSTKRRWKMLNRVYPSTKRGDERRDVTHRRNFSSCISIKWKFVRNERQFIIEMKIGSSVLVTTVFVFFHVSRLQPHSEFLSPFPFPPPFCPLSIISK